MKIGVIIPAAGQGKRMKTKLNKQFLTLAGRPIVAHTIEKFYQHKSVNRIVVVVRKSEMDYFKKEIIEKYCYDQITLVAGGETRRQSVYAGLMAFPPAIDYVIIHDGARPLIPARVIDKTIKALSTWRAVTTGVNVKDTIKRRDNNGLVVETLDRDKLIRIQTPQAFAYKLIKRVHEEIPQSKQVSDDASLVETAGHPVRVIEGSYQNIKITTPIDLVCAEAVLEKG